MKDQFKVYGTKPNEPTEHVTLKRRKYWKDLTCQDCGKYGATIVTFWLNGMRYRVCSTCIKAYRGKLLKPCLCEKRIGLNMVTGR